MYDNFYPDIFYFFISDEMRSDFDCIYQLQCSIPARMENLLTLWCGNCRFKHSIMRILMLNNNMINKPCDYNIDSLKILYKLNLIHTIQLFHE